MKKYIALCFTVLLALSSLAQAGTILRYGLEINRSDMQYLGATRFAELLKERSNGEIEVRLYPDNTLGNATALIAGVRAGTIDIEMSGNVMFAGLAKELQVVDLPYLFKDYDHVDRVLTGEIGKYLLDALEQYDLKGLGFWEVGFRHITNSRHEIHEPADVSGLKIRIAPNPYHMQLFRILGANPVAMPLGEVYTAMETKSIDGQEQPLGVCWSGKYHEVQKHLSLTKHAYTASCVVMNKDKFYSFSPEMQKIILECAAEAGEYEKKLVRDLESEIVENLKKLGHPVVENPNVEAFRQAIQGPVYEAYIKENGDEWVKRIEALRDVE